MPPDVTGFDCSELVDWAAAQMERKDITSASGGTFTLPAFGSAALTRPGIIATPVENALQTMAKVHNAMHGSDPAKRADVTALRAVYRRGTNAYSKRRHPASSRRKWAMARVKNHLTMLATGQRPHARYVGDDDLLPASHPHALSTAGERKALLVVEGRRAELGIGRPVTIRDAAVMLEGKGFLAALGSLEVKGRPWDPDKHPRDAHGRFIHIGAAISAMIDGKQQEGTVLSMGRGGVTVRTADGAEHAVKAADATVTDHVGPHMSVAEHVRAHADADTKARQLEKAGHPEAAAWAQRRDALGAGLRGRVDDGESIHDPYTPQVVGPPPGRENLATPEGLHSHLSGPPPHGHGKDVQPFTDEQHPQFAQTHHGEHQLGDAGHTHPATDAATASQATPADVPRPGDAPNRPDGSEWGSGYADGDPRSDPNYDRYVANTDAKNDLALEQVGDTATVHDYVEGADGAYQPDRQAQHDALIDELLARYEGVPKERKAVVLAGPSGAGKSTTIRLLGHEFGVESDDKGQPTNFATLNPDDIKEMMVERGMVDPGSYGPYGLGPQEGMTLIHEESSHIAKALREELIARGHNIIVDGTFTGKLSKKVGEVMKYRANGYHVTGVLVDGSIDRSLSNAGKRHRRIPGTETLQDADPTPGGAPLQGRYVPLSHIEAQRPTGIFSEVLQRPHLSQNAENFEGAKEAFNGGFRVYSNATGKAMLVHSEESSPDPARAGIRAVSDKHLERLRTGQAGGKISRADEHGMLATALVQAAQEGRPVYVDQSGAGYVVNHAPLTRDGNYLRVSPDGLVARHTAGGGDAQPIPATDVEKIIDHYVKPGGRLTPQADSNSDAVALYDGDKRVGTTRPSPTDPGKFEAQHHNGTDATVLGRDFASHREARAAVEKYHAATGGDPSSSPEAHAAHLNTIDPEGQWEPRPNATHGGTDVVSRARGNVGRSFDAAGKDTGGVIGRMGGGGRPRR